jgi:hypothetical protein
VSVEVAHGVPGASSHEPRLAFAGLCASTEGVPVEIAMSNGVARTI